MQSDQFWTSIDLLGLPIGPIQAFSSIYAVGQFLKTKIILGRTDGPSTVKPKAHSYRIIDAALLTGKIVIIQSAKMKLPKI